MCVVLPFLRVCRTDDILQDLVAVLTPDEVPEVEDAAEVMLSAEPSYVGEPIVAVAAETEQIAEDAVVVVEGYEFRGRDEIAQSAILSPAPNFD